MTQPSTPSSIYTAPQQQMQAQFDARALADRLEAAIVVSELDDRHTSFIESRDFFFLASVNSDGEPTASYKGGAVGFVRVVDPTTLTFPIYDGNGMFLSAGNMSETGKVGMLFIDLVTPQRLRVQGDVIVSSDETLTKHYPAALLVCQVSVTSAFVNCARYIHKHERVAASASVPDADGEQPVATWKRIDGMQDVISEDEQARVADAGGVITEVEYAQRLMAGET